MLINLGNFGNQVARPGPVSRVRQGDPVGQAVEQLGATGQGIANDMRAQETRQQAQEFQRQTEEAKAEQRRQAAVAEAARKAKEAVALHGTHDELRAAHDDLGAKVLAGEVPREEAGKQWAEMSRKIIQGAAPNFSEQSMPLVQMELDGVASRYEKSLGRVVEKRGRQEVTAAIKQTLEFTARQYQTDPVGAQKQATQTLEALGQYSDLRPEEIQSMGQRWKENTQFTAGFMALEGARGDAGKVREAIKRIDSLPDMDPQQKATLKDKAADEMLRIQQRANIAAEAAARAQEAKFRKAEASFNAAQALADYGTLSPEESAKHLAAVSGTPYEAAFRGLLKQQAEAGPLTRQAPDQVREQIAALNADIAKNGVSEGKIKRLKQLETVARGQETDIAKDPRRAFADRYLEQPEAPIDTTSLQGIAQSLAKRAPVSDAAAAWAKKPVAPLYDHEVEPVRKMLDSLPPKEKAGAVAMLSQALGKSQAVGLAQQLAGKDNALRYAFEDAAKMTTEGRFTSELYLKGAQAKKDGTSTKVENPAFGVKPSAWESHIATVLDGSFADQATTDAAKDRAMLIAHAISAENAGKLNADDLDRAARLAIGGNLVPRGQMVRRGNRMEPAMLPLPAGVTEDALDNRLSTITRDEILKQAPTGMVRAAGQEVFIEDFIKSLPGRPLLPVRNGVYTPLENGRPITNHKGQPITIEVR